MTADAVAGRTLVQTFTRWLRRSCRRRLLYGRARQAAERRSVRQTLDHLRPAEAVGEVLRQWLVNFSL